MLLNFQNTSINKSKKVLNETLSERTSPISCTLLPAWQITSLFVYVFLLTFKQDIKCSISSSRIPLKRAVFDRKIIHKISFLLFKQHKYRYYSNIIQVKSQERTVRKGNAYEGSCRKGLFNSKGKRLHPRVHGIKVNL